MLIATPAIRNLIREGKTHQIYSAMQAGAQQGMHTMDQHLADLVKTGKISYETGLEKCHHVEDFNRLTGRASGGSQGARPDQGRHGRQLLRGGQRTDGATATKTYEYAVRDRGGKIVKGRIEAPNQAAVANRLKTMGLAPMSINEVSTGGLKKEIRIPGFGGNKITLKDLAIMARQLATMIDAGLSLLRSLTILAEQTESKPLAKRPRAGAQRRRGRCRRSRRR